jgi:hypothetical protein
MILLYIVTLGIYSLYWSVSTKNEMNKLGANVPTAWLLIVPFVSLYWLWKYSEAVDHTTGSKISMPLAFVLEAFVGPIGDLVIQSEFNKLAAAPAGGAPVAPAPGIQPDNSFGGPIAPAAPAAPDALAPAAPVAPSPVAEPAPAPTPVTNPTPVTVSEAPSEPTTTPQTPPTVG